LSSYEVPYGGWVHDDDIIFTDLIEKTPLKINEMLFLTSNLIINRKDFAEYSNLKHSESKTVVIDLSVSIDEYFYSFINTNLRNKIKRARKMGVTIEKIESGNLNVFFGLLNELKKKVGMRQRDHNYYQRVFCEYEKSNKAVCLAAKYNNEYISAVLNLANKNYAIGWIAGRKIDIPNNLYQNELLYWESAVWAKNSGCKYFDLGGLDLIRLPNLARIKLSFSKNIVTYFTMSKKSLYSRALNRVQKIIFKSN
jgi:lipid II:glycine glycyltransferase (peptidoglycan interpeptide bridge formation enzyme)